MWTANCKNTVFKFKLVEKTVTVTIRSANPQRVTMCNTTGGGGRCGKNAANSKNITYSHDMLPHSGHFYYWSAAHTLWKHLCWQAQESKLFLITFYLSLALKWFVKCKLWQFTVGPFNFTSGKIESRWTHQPKKITIIYWEKGGRLLWGQFLSDRSKHLHNCQSLCLVLFCFV